MKAIKGFFLATALLAVLAGCKRQGVEEHTVAAETSTPPPKEVTMEPEMDTSQGSCETVFDGEICSWSKSKDGQLHSFGVTVAMATVENAPAKGEMVFPPITHARVAMTDVVKAETGIDHLGVNWEIYGHPPQTFMTPHFDFHFYMVPGEEVMAIDCQDLTMPDPAIVPQGYVLPDEYIPEMELMLVGLCVPGMGMHAVNAEEAGAEEFFDGTMIVGYIHGKTIFIEPMIAKHTLMRRQDLDIELPDMGDRGDGLANPADFMGYYDAENDAFNLTFMMASAE